MAELQYRFRLRRRTAASWASLNEVLLDSEIGIESDTGLTDGSRKLKIGDGVTAWNALPYFSTASGGGSLPTGGTIGQVLTKISATDGDAGWQTPSGGGGALWRTGFNNTQRVSNFSNPVTARCSILRSALDGFAFTPFDAPAPTKIGFVFGAFGAISTIVEAYVRKAKNNSQGYPIDFDGTPQQLSFSGSASVSIAAGGIAIADPVDLSSIGVLTSTDSIVLSYYASTINGLSYGAALPGYKSYFLYSTDQSSSTATSGFTASSYAMHGIQGIYVYG